MPNSDSNYIIYSPERPAGGGDGGGNGGGYQGSQGPQGYQGTPGQQGNIYYNYPPGPQGYQGNSGVRGYQGFQGSSGGPQGYQGYQGVAGSGSQGYQGRQGYQGNPGQQGVPGAGSVGPQGYPGVIGPQGNQGVRGYQGDAGPAGGAQGYQGFQGSSGVAGPSGGAQGYQGFQGYQGSTGVGSPGSQGYQGVSGGGGGNYINANPVPVTVGGIESGTSFPVAKTMQQMFDALLYPYQNPSFLSFQIQSQSNVVESGQSLSGSKNFQWSTSNSSNIQSNSIQILDLTSSSTLATGIANSGSFTYNISPSISHNSGNHTWQIRGSNTNSGIFVADYTITWLYRLYYGTSSSATLTGAGITNLQGSILASGSSRTYSFPGGNYKFLAFPASFDPPSMFKDSATLLNVAMADSSDDPSLSGSANGYAFATVSVTNTYGVTADYRLYRSKNMLGGSINIQVS